MSECDMLWLFPFGESRDICNMHYEYVDVTCDEMKADAVLTTRCRRHGTACLCC